MIKKFTVGLKRPPIPALMITLALLAATCADVSAREAQARPQSPAVLERFKPPESRPSRAFKLLHPNGEVKIGTGECGPDV